MKFRLEFAPQVRHDWKRLPSEVFDAFESEAVTAAYQRRVRAACDPLMDFPERYPAWRYDPTLRALPVKKYHVFYRVIGDDVRILHIRYAGRMPYRFR